MQPWKLMTTAMTWSVLATVAQPAAAYPLTLLTDSRFVFAETVSPGPCYEMGGFMWCEPSITTNSDSAAPTSPFAAFEEQVQSFGDFVLFEPSADGTAFQSSTVTNSGAQAYGTAGWEANSIQYASASSYFQVTFAAAVDSTFLLDVSLSGVQGNYFYIQDLGPGQPLLVGVSNGQDLSNYVGALQAGHSYRMVAAATPNSNFGPSSFGFDFEVTAVPEPGTLLLAGAGFLGLIRRPPAPPSARPEGRRPSRC